MNGNVIENGEMLVIENMWGLSAGTVTDYSVLEHELSSALDHRHDAEFATVWHILGQILFSAKSTCAPSHIIALLIGQVLYCTCK